MKSTETVREFATRFGNESFTDAAALLTQDGREQVVESFPDEFREGELDAEEALEQYWRGLYGQYGAFETVGDVSADEEHWTVEFEFVDGTERGIVGVGSEGITSFSFAPAYEVPDYVDRDAFTERSLPVDTGDLRLDGTLTVPERNSPVPGVVLVHGHGIHDQDGTAGASKILKDLAWGLASQGIATLRYEKRLNDHEVPAENYTLDTVVTDDAVTAVSTLTEAEGVAGDSVFVAGHSQGGMCGPRIADRHGDVAGVLILDGPADPGVDPDEMVAFRYSMEPDGNLSESQKQTLQTHRETFRRIADGEFDPAETIMGKPGVWYQSHREYDPVATASKLSCPVFAAGTARTDEQMQAELAAWLRDRFSAWERASLPDGSRTELYETVGHYFQEGPTPVTPTRLYFGGNVAEDVLTDVKDWIQRIADS